MKITIWLAALAGLLLAIALIAYHGFGAVAQALRAAGWFGVAGVTVYHLVPMILSGLGWRSLLHTTWQGSAILYFWARLIREAVNNLLPVAQIGGEFVGARVLTFRGAAAGVAGGSAVVDLTVEALTQFLFTVLGLALLLLGNHDESTVRWVLVGLAILGPALAGFVLAQRWGMFLLFERLLERLAGKFGWPTLALARGLHDSITAIYRDRRGLSVSCLLHLLSWIFGAGEVWLALKFMGHPVDLRTAFILESLGQAVRSAAFAVPGALGVQEGGYLLLVGLFGLRPEVGLALSLVKRARDVLLGLPALAAWQVIEGGRRPGISKNAQDPDEW